jgi:parvulin-like peptidyl-prolyl isomerase
VSRFPAGPFAATLLLASLSSLPRVVAIQEPSGGTALVLVDRVVAVVNADPILQSDVEQVIGLGLVERREGESEASFRRRVLDGLIEQRLRLQQVGQLGAGRLAVDDIEAQLEELVEQLGGRTAFERRLALLSLSRQEVRQLVARQLAVLTYVQERLGPRVFVGLEDIRTYYEEQLTPELVAQGRPVPPLEEVRELVRAVLREQRLNEEIERWTRQLRREADIQLLLDDYPEDLPPVIEGVDGDTSGTAGTG